MYEACEGNEVVLEWRVHLAAQKPVKAAFAVMMIAGFLGALFQITHDIVYVAIGIVVFLVASAPFFYPVTYRIDASGVSKLVAGSRRHLEWTRISGYTVSTRGIYFAVGPRSTVFTDRGMYVMFGDKREEILAGFKKWLDTDKAFSGQCISR